MNDIPMRFQCSSNYIVSDLDWYRLQVKILKHIVCNRTREIWEDVFAPQELQQVRVDLKEQKCPGLACSSHAIDIGLCQACGRCEKNKQQEAFRQKLYDYLRKAITNDDGTPQQGRHSHGTNRRLSLVADEGTTIGLKRIDKDRYVFKTVFLGSGKNDAFITLYLNATPASRRVILKDMALQQFQKNNETIHYTENFRK